MSDEQAGNEGQQDEAGKKMRTTQNGVVRPAEGTISNQIWTHADAISGKTKAPATRGAVMSACEADGLHKATVSTQFARWCKFNGVVPQQSSPELTEAKQTAKDNRLLAAQEAKSERDAEKAADAAELKAAQEEAHAIIQVVKDKIAAKAKTRSDAVAKEKELKDRIAEKVSQVKANAAKQIAEAEAVAIREIEEEENCVGELETENGVIQEDFLPSDDEENFTD